MSTKEPTLTEFRTMFPELTATDHTDAAVTLAIELAEHFHSRSKVGWLLAAAHLVTDEGQLTLTSAEDGEVTADFVAGDVFFGSTRYGRRLTAIEKRAGYRFSAFVTSHPTASSYDDQVTIVCPDDS